MARVSVLGVSLLENPSPFGHPLRFQVQFECGEALPHGEYAGGGGESPAPGASFPNRPSARARFRRTRRPPATDVREPPPLRPGWQRWVPPLPGLPLWLYFASLDPALHTGAATWALYLLTTFKNKNRAFMNLVP